MIIVTDNRPHLDVEAILPHVVIEEIKHHMAHYPQPRAAVLDALKEVQKIDGWVDDAKLHAVAHLLSMSVADVEGVATFYNRIYRQQVGRHVILLCDSIACFLTGYETLYEQLKNALGIEFGQTTGDGRFTLLPVCCLGNCDKGPTLMIDDETFGPVTSDNLSQILEGFE